VRIYPEAKIHDPLADGRHIAVMLPNIQAPWDAFNTRAGREGWAAVCDASLSLDSPQLHDLLDIWRRTAGTRPMPARADFTARALIRHLKSISFIERVQPAEGPRRYFFRMIGREQLRGAADGTGKYLDEVIAPRFIASWNAAYDMVIDSATPIRFVSNFHALKLDFLTAESLIMPLADAAGAPWGFLTSTAFTPRVALPAGGVARTNRL